MNRHVVVIIVTAVVLIIMLLWVNRANGPREAADMASAGQSAAPTGILPEVHNELTEEQEGARGRPDPGSADAGTAENAAGAQGEPGSAPPATGSQPVSPSSVLQGGVPGPQAGEAVLRPFVHELIDEVQARALAGQWEAALNELNALYAYFDELNEVEQSTLLNFYTNVLLALDMHQEAIVAFEQILEITETVPAARSHALIALGELFAEQGDYASSVGYLSDWLVLSTDFPEWGEATAPVLLLLSNGYFELGQYEDAIAPLESNIILQLESGAEVPAERYVLLHELYLATGRTEDADAVRELLEQQISTAGESAR